MRYGLISDIHSNLEALQAALEDLSKQGIDKYLCIGDVVGYGADPNACIRLIKSLDPAVLIAGNHEWGAVGLMDLEYFNEMAGAAIEWTKSALGHDEIEYLRSFKLAHEGDKFTLVHGTLESPEKFYYMMTSDDARKNMELMKSALCFVGHTHSPGILYSYGDKMGYAAGPKVKLDRNKKYMINIGSIGQPRDSDPRASYAIYDDAEGSVELRRTAYDVASAQGKILKAGLPKRLAARLPEGR